jgi:hypothetical protein
MGEFSAHIAAVAYVLTSNSKNLKIQMGRCPVRSIFPEALEVLAKNQDKFR